MKMPLLERVSRATFSSYLCQEVMPWVDERPVLFGALATHSGDNLYELYYISLFAKGAHALRQCLHDIIEWWKDFGFGLPFSKDTDTTLPMLLGLSACFSAADDGTVELPFDPFRCVAPRAMAAVAGLGPLRVVPHYAEVVFTR